MGAKSEMEDLQEEDDIQINPIPAGEFVPEFPKYNGVVEEMDCPEAKFSRVDYQKRLRFEQLKSVRIESLCHWKQKDHKGIKKNAYIKEIQRRNDQILTVNDKTKLEKLEVYTDRFPMLNCRKKIQKVTILIHLVCKNIIESKPFDNGTITVILANSLVMSLEGSSTESPPFFVAAEDAFLALYTFEAVVKIIGKGFIMGDDAYIKDPWNILDFSIVIISYTTTFLA